MIAIWGVIGFIAVWVVNTVFGSLFLGFSAFTILIVMRRQMCGSGFVVLLALRGLLNCQSYFYEVGEFLEVA
jgi:hypothetical protein